MTQFVETTTGYVRADRIAEIKERADGTVLILDDELCRELQLYAADIVAQVAPVVPANPGFFVLYVVEGEESASITTADIGRDAIIGWRVDDLWPQPVTVDGLPKSYAIIDPFGRVTEQSLGNYDSITNWIEKLNNERQKAAGVKP